MRHDEAALVAFLAGALSPEEAQEFDAHLLGCESCWAAVCEDRAGRDALATLRVAASPELRERVRLAVGTVPDTAGGNRSLGGPARRNRARTLAGVLAGVVVAVTATGALVLNRRTSSADPPPVAAVVELARLQSSILPAERNGGRGATARPRPTLELGDQEVWLDRHLVDGREVVVATSDRAFPMPADARPLGAGRGAPWLARRGDLGIACLSRPAHMLLVGDLPAEQLVEIGRQLAATP